MSQENVQLARQGIDAFNGADLDALAGLTTPECEWFPALPGAVEGAGYWGHDGIARYLGEVADTWEEIQVLGDEFRDLGDHVLALGRAEGRGRASGVQVNAQLAIVFDFRGDKISRVCTYLDHSEARLAAGLSD